MANKFGNKILKGTCVRCGNQFDIRNPKEYRKGLHTGRHKIVKGNNYSICEECLKKGV
jgi:RNA polymerase-binding transcription factor DksA